MTSRATAARDTVSRLAAELRDEVAQLTSDLIRFPTVNPPGEGYTECARFIGDRLGAQGFVVDYVVADGRPEHTSAHPRVNVIARREGSRPRPVIHLNGHIDVVPTGGGWTTDPFAGAVRDGRVYGRGAADMKGGIAAAMMAAEAIRRANVALPATIEMSGTVDEESGGFAGVAHLAEIGRVTSSNTDFVIIPEPLNVDRVCIGHRGVYWFEIETEGRIAHGSMPFLGVSAIDHMQEVLHELRHVLYPAIAQRRSAMPVVPDGARTPTLNINAIVGGQAGEWPQSPCVADRCTLIADRRFIIEESFDTVRQEIVDVLERVQRRIPDFRYALRDRLIVHPVQTPAESRVIGAVQRGIRDTLGRDGALIASPGTYDHKHFTRLGGIADCVAYGPGILDISHQPDEYVSIDDLVHATQVLALAILDLAHVA